MTTYACKECGAPVSVDGTKIVRQCQHSTAGVTANMQAVAVGRAKLRAK